MNKNVLLYSNGCPNCNTLKNLLKKAGVPFEENNSIEEMIALGFTRTPVLCVDGVNLEYEAAKKWVAENNKGENN